MRYSVDWHSLIIHASIEEVLHRHVDNLMKVHVNNAVRLVDQ